LAALRRFVAAIAYPVGVILKRLGYSPLWAAVALVPILNLAGLWVVALAGRDQDAGREPPARSAGVRRPGEASP
jgi:hypothetical protein